MPDRIVPEDGKGAVFDGAYRYLLWRIWSARMPRALFIGFNPSTATAQKNDPTITRETGFAVALGYGGFEKVNLYGLVTPYPKELRRHPAPVGPECNDYIFDAIERAEVVIAAWGAIPRVADQPRTIIVTEACERLGKPIMCLGKTAGGAPRHPLYLPGNTRLEPWR